MNLRLRPLRSLRNRLALLFFAVTALALAVVVFVFLPQLESQIVDQKLSDLKEVAGGIAPRLQRVMGSQVTGPGLDKLVRTMSDRSHARLTPPRLQPASPRPR